MKSEHLKNVIDYSSHYLWLVLSAACILLRNGGVYPLVPCSACQVSLISWTICTTIAWAFSDGTIVCNRDTATWSFLFSWPVFPNGSTAENWIDFTDRRRFWGAKNPTGENNFEGSPFQSIGLRFYYRDRDPTIIFHIETDRPLIVGDDLIGVHFADRVHNSEHWLSVINSLFLFLF